MSFWKVSPGPNWTDFFHQLNPFSNYRSGIIEKYLQNRGKLILKPKGTRFIILSPKFSEKIEGLLSRHYQTFPRSKIFLSAQKIREGILHYGWLGCGLLNEEDTLIGCCFSRPLGTLQENRVSHGAVGLVDFFCVDTAWRKKGVASYLLQELVALTSIHQREIHIFQKEGFPLLSLPSLWQSTYMWRRSQGPSESSTYLSKLNIEKGVYIADFDYLYSLGHETLVCRNTVLSPHTDIYIFNYLGKKVYLAITDTFHRSVPEGHRIGEVLWCIPYSLNVPKGIQRLAFETLVDNCGYDIILADKTLYHSESKHWNKDTMYSYYIFNYRPSRFFSTKPSFLP